MPVGIEWRETEISLSYKISRSSDGKPGTFTEIVTDRVGTTYIDAAGSITDFYQVIGVDRFGDEIGAIQEPFNIYTIVDTDFCRIFGNMTDANGRPQRDAYVRFEVRIEDTPQVIGTTVSTDKAEFARTNAEGNFEIYLRRNLLIEMFQVDTKFQLLFTVPDEASKDFSLLDGTFGFQTEITNPF